MKSFSTIKTIVGTNVQDTSSACGTTIGYWVNNRYRDIINSYDWEQLYHEQSITASANVSAYALDRNTERIVFAHDKTNDTYAQPITEQEYLQGYYDVYDEANQPEVCFLQSAPVSSQPTSAEKLIVKSSSASDTTQTVLIRGLTSTIEEMYESLSLSGSSAVSATYSYTRLLGISKSAATAGKVTVYKNDAATALAILAPEQLNSRYKILHFHPMPDSDAVWALKTKRVVMPLSQDYDYPIIENISDIIEKGAEADAWKYKRQFAKARELEVQYQLMKSNRIFQEVSQPGIVHTFTADPLDRNDGIL